MLNFVTEHDFNKRGRSKLFRSTEKRDWRWLDFVIIVASENSVTLAMWCRLSGSNNISKAITCFGDDERRFIENLIEGLKIWNLRIAFESAFLILLRVAMSESPPPLWSFHRLPIRHSSTLHLKNSLDYIESSTSGVRKSHRFITYSAPKRKKVA